MWVNMCVCVGAMHLCVCIRTCVCARPCVCTSVPTCACPPNPLQGFLLLHNGGPVKLSCLRFFGLILRD